MSIEQSCEVCGAILTGRGKCPKAKYHPKVKKIQSLIEGGSDAFLNYERFKQSAYDSLNTAKTVDEEVEAYKKLVYAYYVRFLGRYPNSSITYETYMGLMLDSGLYEADKRQDAVNILVDEYGKVFGMDEGKTYVFKDGVERYIENSIFRAYAYYEGWVVTDKKTGDEKTVPYNLLRKTSTEDYVFGYAKCLFYGMM